jgi:hypothetical protein
MDSTLVFFAATETFVLACCKPAELLYSLIWGWLVGNIQRLGPSQEGPAQPPEGHGAYHTRLETLGMCIFTADARNPI